MSEIAVGRYWVVIILAEMSRTKTGLDLEEPDTFEVLFGPLD